MKIFLTGASGLVGGAFAQAAARSGHEVIGTTGTFVGGLAGLARQLPLDLTATDVLTCYILDALPDAIVNCAAISEPAACTADPAHSQPPFPRPPVRPPALSTAFTPKANS